MPRFQSLALAACALVASLFVSGCSTSFAPSAVTSDAAPLGSIAGHVHGGRQPIVNAHVFVLQAGTGGDAGPGILPSSANKSSSLITSTNAAGFDSNVGGYYVLTDSGGGFTVSNDYTCVPGVQVYLLALGGEPDGVTENDSIGIMAVLGTCGTAFSSATSVYMNEVSTIAAAYALSGFASDAYHVSSKNTSLAITGITNAFANAAQLYNLSSPLLNANATTPNGNGTVPQKLIDSLGNSLAACVNTSDGSQCTTLFANTKDLNGNTPADTATAAINIAHNPGANVDAIFTLPGPLASYPFTPDLSAGQEPNDFSIGIDFTGSSVSGQGLSSVQDVAVDASGNVWATSVDNYSVTEFSPLGVPTFINSGGINFPIGVAVDQLGEVWVANSNPSLTRIVAGVGTNVPLGGSDGANYIAIDSNDQIWASTYSASTIYELNTAGGTVAGPFNFTSPGTYDPGVIAIDSSNNLWGVSTSSPALIGISSGSVNEYPETLAPQLTANSGIAVDSSSNLWAVATCGSCGGGSNEAIAKLNSSGTIVATYPDTSLYGYGLAIDGDGDVWVSQGNPVTVSDPDSPGTGAVKFNSNGTLISPAGGYTGGNQSFPAALAIDGSGDVWLANTGDHTAGTTVTELIGAATPVVTPISPLYPGQTYSGLGIRP